MRYSQFLRSLWTDQRGVVPGELGNRLGQFLQPAVVGKAAVVNARIRTEDEFDVSRGRGFDGGQIVIAEFRNGADRSER